jgi:hypothetical protein
VPILLLWSYLRSTHINTTITTCYTHYCPLLLLCPILQPGGAWEDKSQWLARMSKMLCTFCVIMIQPEQQPVSLADAWAWLANIVNISTPVPAATTGDKGRLSQNEWLCGEPLPDYCRRHIYHNCGAGVLHCDLFQCISFAYGTNKTCITEVVKYNSFMLSRRCVRPQAAVLHGHRAGSDAARHGPR